MEHGNGTTKIATDPALLGMEKLSDRCVSFLNDIDILLKFIYSEKATNFFEISTLLLTGTTKDKSEVKISQNFVAFSEYMNFHEGRLNGSDPSSHLSNR